MNRVLFNYLFTGYLKTILKVILIAYCFGIILNLFEEIEFFKNLDENLLIPITLTALFIPSIILVLLFFFYITMLALEYEVNGKIIMFIHSSIIALIIIWLVSI